MDPSNSLDRPRLLTCHVLAVTIVAALYAGLMAYLEGGHRSYPLDIDGWGFLAQRLKETDYSFQTLFDNSFLKRGPVVPLFFGFWFYLTRFDESIVVLNVILFSLSVGCFFVALRVLNVHWLVAYAVALLWLCYLLPQRYIFGYYFAEPIISFFGSVVFLLVAIAIVRTSVAAAFSAGCIAALLLMARPPYLFVVGAIPILLYCRVPTRKAMYVAFVAGLLLFYAPWPLRNLLVYGEFIPFTTEGSLALFQGTYVPGDDAVYNDQKRVPEFAEIENNAKRHSEVGRLHYWKALALKQVMENPRGQIYLLARKAIGFWVYLPQFTWTPNWRSAAMAACALFLAVIGYLRHRQVLLIELCALWTVGLWLFHALVHSELRYNFSVVPMMLTMAVFGFSDLFALAFSGRLVRLSRLDSVLPGICKL